jgi:hypothetical protein
MGSEIVLVSAPQVGLPFWVGAPCVLPLALVLENLGKGLFVLSSAPRRKQQRACRMKSDT